MEHTIKDFTDRRIAIWIKDEQDITSFEEFISKNNLRWSAKTSYEGKDMRIMNSYVYDYRGKGYGVSCYGSSNVFSVYGDQMETIDMSKIVRDVISVSNIDLSSFIDF